MKTRSKVSRKWSIDVSMDSMVVIIQCKMTHPLDSILQTLNNLGQDDNDQKFLTHASSIIRRFSLLLSNLFLASFKRTASKIFWGHLISLLHAVVRRVTVKRHYISRNASNRPFSRANFIFAIQFMWRDPGECFLSKLTIFMLARSPFKIHDKDSTLIGILTCICIGKTRPTSEKGLLDE